MKRLWPAILMFVLLGASCGCIYQIKLDNETANLPAEPEMVPVLDKFTPALDSAGLDMEIQMYNADLHPAEERYQVFTDIYKFFHYGFEVRKNLQELTPNELPEISHMLDYRVNKMIEDLKEGKLRENRVWFIYGMGYLVKTGDKFLIFDLTRARISSRIPELANFADVLLLSNLNPRNFDTEVVKAAAGKGTTIIFPKENLVSCPDAIMTGLSCMMNVTGLPPSSGRIIQMEAGKSVNVSGFEIQAFSTSNTTTNYAYLVKGSDGTNLLHLGDLETNEGQEWLEQMKNVSLLMLSVSIRQKSFRPVIEKRSSIKLVPSVVMKVNPKVVVPGNMHKLSLDIQRFGLYSYLTAYEQYRALKKMNSTSNYVPLFWGEGFNFS